MSKQLAIFTLAAAGLSSFGLVDTASATNRNVTLCAQYKVDFTDSDLGLPAAESDDYATAPAAVSKASQISRKIEICEKTTG